MDSESLRSARTARTYPVGRADLARVIQETIRELPRWELGGASGDEVRAVRRTRLGFAADVSVRLASLSGVHTNTHARFESRSRAGPWDLGRNWRNLSELLRAIDKKLMPEA